jgi:hypothetical protein
MREGIRIRAAKDGRAKNRGGSPLSFRFLDRNFQRAIFPFFVSPHSTLVSNGMRCNSLQTKNPCTSHPSLFSGAKQGILEDGNGAVECPFLDSVFVAPPQNPSECDRTSRGLLGGIVGAIMAPLSMTGNLLECTRGFLWL